MAIVWAYIGNCVCDSKLEKGAKVIYMSYSAAHKCVDDALDNCMRSGFVDKLTWLRDRDWATRTRMTELMRTPHKMPACAALDKALDEYRQAWNPFHVNHTNADGSDVKETPTGELESGARKRQREQPAQSSATTAAKMGVDI